MNFEEAEKYIHSFTRFGSQLGLERMTRLLSLIGNPHKKLKFVHVAGTNGKGSTVTMCANALHCAGYKTGLYISPFVVDFRERFQINGKMIHKEEFAELVEEINPFIKQMAEEGDNVTEFEMITAIAFVYFERHNCDIVCLEVGLGGRYDATNVISAPLCALIASISLDHTEILGDTIPQIAYEKAGIIKENTDVVLYPLMNLDAQVVLLEKCAQTNSRCIIPNFRHVEVLKREVTGSKFIYNDKEYSVKLTGDHQIYNAVAVIEAMNVLKTKGFDISYEAVFDGIKKTVLPARFEIMSKKPLIIVDGAHNSEAVESLCVNLKKLHNKPLIAIMGMMGDKDVDTAVRLISQYCSAIIAVSVPNNKRALSADDMALKAKEYCNDVYSFTDYYEAIGKAVSLAGENGGVIVNGSFYMASAIRSDIKAYLAKIKG